MDIWPALDIYEGRVVRLRQGQYDEATVYGEDPVAFIAARFPQAPCRLHLVDLTGARSGRFTQWAALEQLARAGTRIEVGGGLRTEEDIRRALDLGAERVVLGTRLLLDREFAAAMLARFGAPRLVASIDVKEGRAKTAGWLEDGPAARAVWDQLYADGYRLVNVTDIQGDGTLAGLDAAFWSEWVAAPGEVGAGGGIGTMDDIRRLAQWGIGRAVVGKAWITGKISLEDVMPC